MVILMYDAENVEFKFSRLTRHLYNPISTGGGGGGGGGVFSTLQSLLPVTFLFFSQFPPHLLTFPAI